MHALGLIHRDVKPANILLDRERDRAVLVDVGVAVKAGDQRDAAGTPGFAAPESFLEQDGGADDRRLRPRRDDVLHADRPAAVRLGPRAAGRAAPAQRSAARRRRSCARRCRRRSTPCSRRRSRRSRRSGGHPRRRSRSRSAVRSSACARRESACRSRRQSPNIAPQAASRCSSRPRASTRSRARSSAVAALAQDREGRVRAAHLRVLSRILQHHLGESGIAQHHERAPELATAFAATLAPLGWIELSRARRRARLRARRPAERDCRRAKSAAAR